MIAVLKRDLVLAFRSGGGFGLSLAFFLIFITLAPLGIGPDTDRLSEIAAGLLWVGALLSCLLSLDRIFQLDFEDGSLDAFATSPLPYETLALSKALAHWLTSALPVALASPLLALLLNLPPQGYTWLTLSLLIGTPALSVIGTFGAALTFGLKRGGLLLSLLVLPLYVPTLIFGALAASRAALGLDATTPLALLGGVTCGCFAILPFATAAAIRSNLR